MIGIVDYGMGNLHSVSKALERLGYAYRFIDRPDDFSNMDGVILPGVGAFGDAMENLKEQNLTEAILSYARSGKPLLGICLGMQLLFDSSAEHGEHRGFGLLQGRAERFEGDFKIPHMGWNALRFLHQDTILSGVEEGYVYFVHSYYIQNTNHEELLAVADYHVEVPAIVGNGRVYGMQFHPEKSGHVGMRLLKNFAELTRHPVTEGEK